ncbi:interferon alpha-inducible protein 27-like protein 2A [Triplophysa dalaica]|uniref:interferon alpha-inducible protein 27-like protein 2A n=1 Tax=Triplophysa dalaica TaxID=1582913 RepID=UPI0024DFB737|nr:interferon alpha-inducible protein 27-like protein 2A [Triplophysa dalaica]
MSKEIYNIIRLTAVGAVGSAVLIPFAIGAAGFTVAGITAGSVAAGMMSSAAIANGGGVATGSLIAILQSAGAAGLSASATAGLASVGGATGAVLGGAVTLLRRMRK